jgi:hypothetical protein
MATKALEPIVNPTPGEAILVENPFQGQGQNQWQALVRNNTVFDLMVIVGVSTTWLGPSEQDYLEFPAGVQSFRMVPIADQIIPANIFSGTLKVTCFDQSSGYDGVFPQALAPPVVIYVAGPQDELPFSPFVVPHGATVTKISALSQWMHTLFVFIQGTPGDSPPTLVVMGTASGFVYFDVDLSIVNDGSVLVAIPWVYAHDTSVTVRVTNNDPTNPLTVAVFEDSNIYPTKTVNGEPYQLLKIGTIEIVTLTGGVDQTSIAVPANRGLKLQARIGNAAPVYWSFDSGVTSTTGDELSPGQAAIIPIQSSAAIFFKGMAGDIVSVVII